MRARPLALAATALTAALTACGTATDAGTTSGTGGSGSSATTSTSAGAGGVAFAQLMIPHHRQAVEMADLALEYGSSTEVEQLATRIKAAQDPEIEQMTQWLQRSLIRLVVGSVGTMQSDFTRLNTKLVGLSIDGLYSNIAWLRTIKDKITYRDMTDVEVTFPLIEDITMEIARKYGMIMPGEDSTKAVRAVFVIDPHGIIRAVIYYPLSLGRNFDELRRVVIALQTADAFDVATPADWRPGEPVIVPPPGSCGTAKDRMDGQEDGVTCIDWFFCTKELTEDEIDDAILSDKNRSDVERVGQRRLQEITPAAPNGASLPVSV